jgi:EAL domain-containing protein (putative c-di-GMP-specific phosphodiesterase class I)
VESACRQLRKWSDALPRRDVSLAVNVTERQFYDPDTVARLKRALAASGADPSRLMLEVPENVLNENPDAAVAILQRLVDCEVRVAVDDFGASLAPLNHLVHLPIDRVKLDAKLSVAATSTGRQKAVLEALIGLGRTLGVQVVAQGIETREQLEALGSMGCELGQGPLLSPALEPAQALELAESDAAALAPEA